jgi:hypothetical protein
LEKNMPIAVKDAAAAAKKFVTRAQAAGPDYANGVNNAGAKWATNTKASADAWQQGVTQAAASGRFASGVTQNTMNKFQTRASGVGAQRYPQGVAGSADAWQANTTPFLNVIASLNLPARQPKGSPANYQRVQAVGDALRAKKLQGGQ